MNNSSSHPNCSINDFKYHVYPATYLTIWVVGFFGNGVSLIIFCKPKKKWSSVNMYLFNLLISDLILVCALPFRVTYYLMESHWIFGDAMCRIMSYAFYLTMYSSIYFLMVLSIMRFLAIVRPYKFVMLRNTDSAKIVCCIVWFFVAAASSPLLLSGIKNQGDKVKCLDPESRSVQTILLMNYVVLLIGCLIPFTVIVVCYFFVVKTLMKPRNTQKKRPSHKKSAAMVIIVTCIFLICFLPYHIVRTLFLETYRIQSLLPSSESCDYINCIHKVAVVTLCLAASNSCLDPLLYFFVGENFMYWWRKRKQQTELKQLNTKDPN
ncbi:cysteinyl leukotriene receptor 2-like [Polyodon spathula]|uniref:cysteinyl leukotriene receptor 2-like n=1 Tax=Polyodon spathula TaxID=7913 RepID=UPI001B7E0837|nr:cysteinyl leukotriene receptor 2-like [Polyodon spathula]XP_041114626.1 cysteinyl leukotriene receptor 2-like [Polyodon spathula]